MVENSPFRLAARPPGVIWTSTRSPLSDSPNAWMTWGSTFMSFSLIGSGLLAPIWAVKSGLKEKLTSTGSKWVPKIPLLMAIRPSRSQLQTEAGQFTSGFTSPLVVTVATTHLVLPGQSVSWAHRMLESTSQTPVVGGFGAEVPLSWLSVLANFTPMPETVKPKVVSTLVCAMQTPGVQMSVKGTHTAASVSQEPNECRVTERLGRLMATLILSSRKVTGQETWFGSMSMWETVVVTVGSQEQPPLTFRLSTTVPFGMFSWIFCTK